MAEYTGLTKYDIEAIAAGMAFGDIISVKLLSGGSENTNYKVDAVNGKYVVTICEQKSVRQTMELVQLLEHLESHGFETSRIIRNANKEPITLWNGKPVVIKKFVEGKTLEHLSNYLLELLGVELGKLHKIEAPDYLPKQLRIGKEQFVKVKEYAANSSFDIWLSKKLDYVSSYFSPSLPKTLIHSDVFCDNVIVDADERSVVLMDFEEAVYNYRIFDIGMTIIGVCGKESKIDFKKAEHLLKGYQEEVQLLDIEAKALQAFTVYAGAAMTFWRHMNFNHTVPDSKLSNHYEFLKVLTDFAEQQPPDRFLNLVKNI